MPWLLKIKRNCIVQSDIFGDEFVTVDKFIPGDFIKYMNNTGERCVEAGDDGGDKAECLCHFSCEKSERNLMVVDIQVDLSYLTLR